MPKGKLTNKTEFMRWLNEHEKEISFLAPLVIEYRKLHTRGNNFGYWLRYHKLPSFDRAYASYWLRHPRFFGSVYAESIP